jgi:isocitrate dehydrogenase
VKLQFLSFRFLSLEQWIKPHMDTTEWEFYDMSCKARDDTNDQVLADSVTAGKKIGAIFKEPTITPNAGSFLFFRFSFILL